MVCFDPKKAEPESKDKEPLNSKLKIYKPKHGGIQWKWIWNWRHVIPVTSYSENT